MEPGAGDVTFLTELNSKLGTFGLFSFYHLTQVRQTLCVLSSLILVHICILKCLNYSIRYCTNLSDN